MMSRKPRRAPAPGTPRILAASALALSAALLVGCAATDDAAAESDTGLAVFSGSLAPEDVLSENDDSTTVNEDEWSLDDAIDVALSGTGAADAAGVTSADGTVTITAAGVYRLSGELDGQVVVDADDDALVVLVLDNATISSDTGSAIEVRTADDVAIHLAAGSENAVSDTDAYAEDADANAAISSDADLTLSGSGSLTVAANGNDGITSTDDLVVLSGTISVDAADDALRGKDALAIEGGELTLVAGTGDGLKSDQEDDETRGYILIAGGTIDITAGDDGVQAYTDTVITGGALTVSAADDGVKAERIVSIGDGEVTVTESYEGVEAANIGVFGGTLDVTASDDGMGAGGADGGDMGGGGMEDTGERLEISGGTVTVDAEGDGLDSNGSLTISGGDVTVYGPTAGANGSLDANGEMSITGGTVVAFGPGTMEETPTDADAQGWVMLTGTMTAGESYEVVDDSGETVATVTPRKASASVITSSGELSTDGEYALVADGTELGTATAGEGGAGGFGGGPGGPGREQNQG